MTRQLSFSAFALAVLTAFAVPASAAVIYNGGAPDQGGQIYSESPGSNVAMSFSLASNSTLTGVDWWGGCFSSTTCDPSPDFSITIWSNSTDGTPDSVIDSEEILVANQTATGKMIGATPTYAGWDEYSYSAALLDFPLDADTTYWLDIQETSGESAGAWGWETTSSAPAGAELESQDIDDSCSPIGTTSWCSLPETLAFQLDGTPRTAVPEPASLALLGSGLVGFGMFRRRKRKAA